MAIIGLDVEAVQQLSRDLKTQGTELDQVITSINSLVSSIPSIWQGKDSTEFINWWESQHKPALTQVRDHVNGLGDSAMANATAQQDVSNS